MEIWRIQAAMARRARCTGAFGSHPTDARESDDPEQPKFSPLAPTKRDRHEQPGEHRWFRDERSERRRRQRGSVKVARQRCEVRSVYVSVVVEVALRPDIAAGGIAEVARQRVEI